MTEAEWLACEDPSPILEFLRGTVSDRKLRLFAVACCRQVWSHVSFQSCREAVTAAEAHADGLTSAADIAAAAEAAWPAVEQCRQAPDDREYYACAIAWCSALPDAFEAATAMPSEAVMFLEGAPDMDPQVVSFFENERHIQGTVAHEIFGNPFQTSTLDSALRTENVTALARAIYIDRAFDRLPILADALEEAGCTNRDILDHCHKPGDHVRGCWVVDLVLGKE